MKGKATLVALFLPLIIVCHARAQETNGPWKILHCALERTCLKTALLDDNANFIEVRLLEGGRGVLNIQGEVRNLRQDGERILKITGQEYELSLSDSGLPKARFYVEIECIPRLASESDRPLPVKRCRSNKKYMPAGVNRLQSVRSLLRKITDPDLAALLKPLLEP